MVILPHTSYWVPLLIRGLSSFAMPNLSRSTVLVKAARLLGKIEKESFKIPDMEHWKSTVCVSMSISVINVSPDYFPFE